MNIGNFAGNVVRDAELKTIPSGKELLEFTLAVNVGWGENKATEWVKATVWGERARKLDPYVKKGTRVSIAGRIRSHAYAAKDNSLKSEIACEVLELTLQGGGEAASKADKPAATAAAPAAAKPAAEWGFDDEIPI